VGQVGILRPIGNRPHNPSLPPLRRKSIEHHIRYNPSRCATRVSPWSTFKIPNSLISIELDIVRDASEITKWDGVMRTPAMESRSDPRLSLP
jgi:beta-lactamase class D